MGQVVDFQVRTHAVGHAVHGADRSIHQTEVTLKYQRIHKKASYSESTLIIVYSLKMSIPQSFRVFGLKTAGAASLRAKPGGFALFSNGNSNF